MIIKSEHESLVMCREIKVIIIIIWTLKSPFCQYVGATLVWSFPSHHFSNWCLKTVLQIEINGTIMEHSEDHNFFLKGARAR